eukprot:Selendium_serpulae@DN5930_c0_g1_i13.p1
MLTKYHNMAIYVSQFRKVHLLPQIPPHMLRLVSTQKTGGLRDLMHLLKSRLMICNLFGLVYFLSWTVSIIPVIIQSFLKRSARHVSLDTTLHDVFGYFAYSVFTCGKYHLQNTSNTASGVYIHDVALIYDRGARQKGPSNRCMATCIVVGCVQVFLWSLASSGRLPQHDGLADGKNLNHFNVLSMLGKFLSFCLCPEIESKSGSDQGHRKRSFLSPTTGRKSNATSNFNQRKVSHQAANNLLFHATIGTGLSIGNVFLD